MIYLKSLAELVVTAYLTSFLGLLLAAGYDLTDVTALKASAIAAIPAGLAVVYGALAGLRGNKLSAVLVDTRD